MVVVYLPAPIFNRPMPLMRAGGSREETDISLIKIDSIHCLPSFFSKSEVLLAALSSSSSSPFPPLMVLRCGESISFSFSGIRERIGIVGIQVDKWTSGQVDPLKYSQLRHKEYITGQHTIQQLAAFTSCKEKQEENGLWGIRGNIARLATVAYWSYPSFPTPSERQRKYK